MNPTPEQIEATFLDVRNAYRLLHDYQRMVMDGVKFLGNQLGLRYEGGWPKFSGVSPRAGGGTLDHWAWDWLNFVAYDFHFSNLAQEGSELPFSVLLISDTGFFCSDRKYVEATDTRTFLPAENSNTKVGFVLSSGEWQPDFMSDREAMKVFIEEGGRLMEPYNKPGILGKCYGLERLMSAESTNQLIDELILEANAACIPLKRQDFRG